MSLRVRASLVVFFVLAGCSSPPEVETIDPAQWPQVLADYRGGITVINVWANWCRACLHFLPLFVTLRERTAYDDVEILSVIVEDPADAAALAEAEALVLELDARFPHFALQTGVEEALAMLGTDDLPVVLVYDSEGRLQHRVDGDPFEGEMHLEDVEDAIDSVLTGSEPGS
ncbi:MAG: redoxin domain-containing protein [Bryobacterales bacterium]|nr:redoxin domain-containing protein [Bryobacterales bacterium]